MASRDYENKDFQDIVICAARLAPTLREGFGHGLSGVEQARAGTLPRDN